MKRKIQVTGISYGTAAGSVWIQGGIPIAQKEAAYTVKNTEAELAMYRAVQQQVMTKLLQLSYKVKQEQGKQACQIFEAHMMLLQDDSFGPEIERRIQDDHVSSFSAVHQVSDMLTAMFEEMDNEYFRERAADIRDIAQQLRKALLRAAGMCEAEDTFPETGKYVVLADELTPAQTVQLPTDRVLAFVMTKGGKTSHAAILARTYGIPAVIAMGQTLETLGSMTYMAVNATEGWIADIEQSESDAYNARQHIQDEALDKTQNNMVLAGNIGSDKDIPLIEKFHAEGVGLFRTEFLFMQDTLPTEEEQFAVYKSVLCACDPNLVVIRTLDIGGDKEVPAMELPKEKNPFLGVRAVRLCFTQPDIFMTQLRALWRASHYGKMAVMFPMIATVSELLKAKKYLAKAKEDVLKAGNPVGTMQIGIMIEIPSAVLMADCLAKEVDFFSIGTNDLTQYTMAADRENLQLAHLNEYHQPAVLRLMAMTVKAAKDNHIWVGICGEASGDELLLPFWASLRIDELSMSPGSLIKARKCLNTFTATAEQRADIVDRVLACSTRAEVKNVLRDVPDILKM